MNVGIFSTLGAKIDHFYVTLTTRAGVRNEGKRFTWPYKATESHFSELINYAYSNTMPRAGEQRLGSPNHFKPVTHRADNMIVFIDGRRGKERSGEKY